MFKKSMIILLVLVLCTSAILSGCTSGEGKKTSGDQSLPHLTAVTAPMGSGWHAVTVLLSDIWMSKIDGLNVSVLEGGSVGNIKAISQGLDANIGWAYTTDLRDAFLGEGSFDKAYSDALPIGVMYPVWLNVVALEGGKINSIEDLKNAKINAGAIGTGSEVAAKRLLEAYGLTYESIKQAGGTVSFGNYSDATTQLKDGIIDVMMGGGAPDIPALHEAETQKTLKLLPADKDALKRLEEKGYGYTTNLPIPANTYKGQTDEVPAVTYQSVMIANRDLPEDLIYNLMKYLWEDIERIRTEQPARGNYMILERALDGIDPKDLHPGAAKYYKEVGILK